MHPCAENDGKDRRIFELIVTPAEGCLDAQGSATYMVTSRTVRLSGPAAHGGIHRSHQTPANRAADPKADPLQWVQPAQVAALRSYPIGGGCGLSGAGDFGLGLAGAVV